MKLKGEPFMAILRNYLRRDYTQVPNELITDMSLSDRGLRIILYLYTKPENWKIRNSVIQKDFKIESNKTMATYWKELLASGWLSREPSRREDGSIKPGYDYILHGERQEIINLEDVPNRKKKKKTEKVPPKKSQLFDGGESVELDVSEDDRPYLKFVTKYNQDASERAPHLLPPSELTGHYTQRCLSAVRLIVTKDQIPLDKLESVLKWASESSFWSSLVCRLPTLRKKGKNEISKIGNIVSQFDADSAPKKTRKRKETLLSKDEITKLYMKDLREYGKAKADRLRRQRIKKRKENGEK